MNNKRRTSLEKALSFLNQASEIVESVKDDEEGALDNIPENLQSSDRYERMEEVISSLEDAAENIDSAISGIESASE